MLEIIAGIALAVGGGALAYRQYRKSRVPKPAKKFTVEVAD